MNKYEVMYVLDAALEDQARQDVISRFSSVVENNGGKVERVDEWGKRRLAYPINYKTEGYYVLMYMSAPSELPRELERNFNEPAAEAPAQPAEAVEAAAEAAAEEAAADVTEESQTEIE